MTRLERISAIVEDTLDKLLLNQDKGDDNIYVRRYNYWIEMFEKEVLKDLNVDTSKLNVSKFMEQLITHEIVRQQKIEDIVKLYSGWRPDDKHHRKYRAEYIKNLYRIH